MKSREDKDSVILTCFSPVMTPIIKIVGNSCNLRCDYCFYHEKNQQERTVMGIEILEKFIRQYLELFDGNLRFNWHGGEPLLAGISFFQKIVELQKRYIRNNQKISNSIQTNGILINKKWAAFFRDNDFEVGVSLDGVKKCHDLFRKNITGQSSFDATIRGIRILQKYKVPIGILHVLTNKSLSYIKENFHFFVNDLQIKDICTCVYAPTRGPCMFNQKMTNKKFTEFFKRVIDFWFLQNNPDLQIRELENFLAGIYGKIASVCGFNGTCSAFFCVDYDGKIYPCDRVSNESRFCIGDLSSNFLRDILNSDKRLDWAKKTKFLHSDCLSCAWRDACRNGCTDYRNDEGKYLFCETRKKIFNYLREKIGGSK